MGCEVCRHGAGKLSTVTEGMIPAQAFGRDCGVRSRFHDNPPNPFFERMVYVMNPLRPADVLVVAKHCGCLQESDDASFVEKRVSLRLSYYAPKRCQKQAELRVGGVCNCHSCYRGSHVDRFIRIHSIALFARRKNSHDPSNHFFERLTSREDGKSFGNGVGCWGASPFFCPCTEQPENLDRADFLILKHSDNILSDAPPSQEVFGKEHNRRTPIHKDILLNYSIFVNIFVECIFYRILTGYVRRR